jgi:hypothetical protein
MGTKVWQSVAQGRWDRAKEQIAKVLVMLVSSLDGLLDHKRLEQIREFLDQISMTYPMVTPYLKGLHLNLASHHIG